MKRRKFLKVAVTPDEYAKLSIEADKQGLTLSAYIRNQLANKQQAIEAVSALARIEAKLLPTRESSAQLEPLIVESLLLIRELISDKNPQAFGRIANKLNSMYPDRSEV